MKRRSEGQVSGGSTSASLIPQVGGQGQVIKVEMRGLVRGRREVNEEGRYEEGLLRK